MQYFYNRTENPIYLNQYEKHSEQMIGTAVADNKTGQLVQTTEKVTYLRPKGFFYFPESIADENFIVALTEEEYKELKDRSDFLALTSGTRAALVNSGTTNPYGSTPAPKALINDTKFTPYSYANDNYRQHAQLNKANA